MLPGKLCEISQGPKGSYYNIQSWQDGENITTYVPRDRVDEFKEAIDGYQHFLALTKKYSQQIVSQTPAELGGGKKSPLTAGLLAQEEEIQQLIECFQTQTLTGSSVQGIEFLIRTALL